MSIVFDRAVEYYDQTRSLPAERQRVLIDTLVQAAGITYDSNVLEIGVGTGRIGLDVVKHLRRLFGVDLSLEMMAVLRNKLAESSARVEIAQANALHLPFADKTFDVAYAVHVYHLVQHWHDALADARRVLKPGGRFVVSFHKRDPDSPNVRLRKQMHAFAREMGIETKRPGAESEEEIYQELAGWGSVPEIIPVMKWQEDEIPEKILHDLSRQIFSETWMIPREAMDEIMPRLRAWATETYSDLSQPIPVHYENRWLLTWTLSI